MVLFIYPHPSELKVFTSCSRRHRSDSFVLLDKEHLNQFPGIVKFAKDFLGTTIVHCKLFYVSNIFKYSVSVVAMKYSACDHIQGRKYPSSPCCTNIIPESSKSVNRLEAIHTKFKHTKF
jgi:hypothetical protein